MLRLTAFLILLAVAKSGFAFNDGDYSRDFDITDNSIRVAASSASSSSSNDSLKAKTWAASRDPFHGDVQDLLLHTKYVAPIFGASAPGQKVPIFIRFESLLI